MSTLPTDPDDTQAGKGHISSVVLDNNKLCLINNLHQHLFLYLFIKYYYNNCGPSLLAGHAEAGVPHPALPAIADVPGGAKAAGAVPVLVIAEASQPRTRAQHPASPMVGNIIEVPGV